LTSTYAAAVAAAMFGDPAKVKYTPMSAQQRFPAIQSGEVDILSRNTTWTLTRDTATGVELCSADLLRRSRLSWFRSRST